MTNLTFNDLGLKETLVKAIDDLGFTTPSQIQAEAIPVALEGNDIIGQAQKHWTYKDREDKQYLGGILV